MVEILFLSALKCILVMHLFPVLDLDDTNRLPVFFPFHPHVQLILTFKVTLPLTAVPKEAARSS